MRPNPLHQGDLQAQLANVAAEMRAQQAAAKAAGAACDDAGEAAAHAAIAKLKLRRSKLEAALASSSPGGAPEGGTMKLFGDAALTVYKRVRLEERAAATCVGCQVRKTQSWPRRWANFSL